MSQSSLDSSVEAPARGGCTKRMKGFRRNAGRGTPGRYESVTDAAKNGFSSSGRNALKVDVREPVGTNSNRARCFGISSGSIAMSMLIKPGPTKKMIHTPVIAPVPEALATVHIDIRDARRGGILVRVDPSVRPCDELVVRSHGRVLISNEGEVQQTALPLRRAVDESQGRRVHRLRGVVGTRREAS